MAQEILKRFAVAWDYITVENDRDFNSQFRETKTANIMVKHFFFKKRNG